MNPKKPRTPLGYRLRGIELTPDGIFELDQEETRALFIVRGSIVSCTIRRGFVAERPLLGAVVGLGMMSVGVMLVLGMSAVFDASPERMAAGLFMAGGITAALGAIMLGHSMRRGLYLELRTTAGTRKLTIGPLLAPSELSTLVERARREYGYDLAVDPAIGVKS